jgi:hypothetical protein
MKETKLKEVVNIKIIEKDNEKQIVIQVDEHIIKRNSQDIVEAMTDIIDLMTKQRVIHEKV